MGLWLHLSARLHKLKFVLFLLVVGGIVHFLVDKYSSFYDDLNLGVYFKSYDDPWAVVLQNSATHPPGSIQTSTVVYGNGTGSSPLLKGNFTFHLQTTDLPRCELSPNLVGPIRVWVDSPKIEALNLLYPDMEKGGHYVPSNCTSNHRVAIVIPFRDREEHLRILLHNLHSFLQKQELDYAILVVEQVQNQTFNRAKLMNIGFTEGMNLYPWECFIFHDVDLLPEDDRNLYSCPIKPRHMSVAIDKFKYQLPYGTIFGGISAMTVEQILKINGFSNDYWGWGGEDDDLSTRVNLAGYQIARYPANIARYKMIKHGKETKSNPINKCRYKLMAKTSARWHRDGLNSLSYKLLNTTFHPLYTRFVVDLQEKDSRVALRQEFRC